jgi:hypothetical protein
LGDHLKEGFDARLGAKIKRTGAIALNGEDRQVDMAADDGILRVPEAEALNIVDDTVHVSKPNLFLDIGQPMEYVIRIGVLGILFCD